MFCPKCGAQNPDGSPFCASCGAQLNAQQQAPQQMNQFGGKPSAGGGFNPQAMLDDFKKNVTDVKSFAISQFITLGGCLLFIISMFLPYLTVKVFGLSSSVSFMSSGAFHWLLAFVIVLGTAFLAIAKQGLPMLIGGGVAFVFAILEGIGNHTALASFGIGFYLMLIAGAAMTAGGVMQFLAEKKK